MITTVPAPSAPTQTTYLVDLPLCTLHVMEAGAGPPLIIVPATLSELENWVDLVRFMGQWFHAYFFELPGHGQSTPLPDAFTSDLVAEAVGQLADRLGAERFSLMGFSFGGILGMKTFQRLKARIDRLLLISPCLTKRALLLTPPQRFAAVQFNHLLRSVRVRTFLWRVAQSPANARAIARFLQVIGKVENRHQLGLKLARLRPSMIEIVSQELDEILSADFPHPAVRHQTPCHMAMSTRDPLLHYPTTLEELRGHFQNLHVTELSFPFHQPPRPFTLDELNESFRDTMEASMAEATASADVPVRRRRTRSQRGSPSPMVRGGRTSLRRIGR